MRDAPKHRQIRRRRWLGWGLFFTLPVAILVWAIWPQTPDLPFSEWGSDLALTYRAEFAPDEYVQGSAILPGPTLSLGRSVSMHRSLGKHQFQFEAELIEVTRHQAIFQITAQQLTETEKFLIPSKEETAEFRIDYNGSNRIEPWPGLTIHASFQPDPGKGWRHHWRRWDQNFDLSWFDGIWN